MKNVLEKIFHSLESVKTFNVAVVVVVVAVAIAVDVLANAIELDDGNV